MRKLPAERRAAILSALCEGLSVNAAARMAGCSKITVLRLLADAGTLCADLHDRMVRGVEAVRIEADELWSFCGCKAATKRQGGQGHGDAWVWVAADADSKLVLSYLVGDRDQNHATALMNDLAERVTGRPQVTTDSLAAYRWAVWSAFEGNVDHAQVHKTFGTVAAESGRYSPPKCTGCTKEVVHGSPDLESASTSHIERQNLSTRMGSRRFTRLTNAFSKTVQNHKWAVALHFWHFNFARKHATLKTTPAVAAGIASRPMSVLDLVRMLEASEAHKGGRLTSYLPAGSPK